MREAAGWRRARRISAHEGGGGAGKAADEGGGRAGKAADERGYVTAETALLLPILLAVGYALTLVVIVVGDQIRCADAAWEAARELARGVPVSELPQLASRYAPEGARASQWSADGALTVEVDRDQSIASRLLPAMRISATATVPCEPRVQGCEGAA